MSVNKKTATVVAAKPVRFTAAKQSALAGVRNAAFGSGVARSAVVTATLAACGAKPILSLYNGAKLELQVGFMAAALVRKGDNRSPAIIMDACRDLILNYQGHGGTTKLRSGSKGRRNALQEAAYGSARALVSGIMKDAGVTVPEARGGKTSDTRKPNAGKVAASAKKVAANDVKPADLVTRYSDRAALLQGCSILASALLGTINRNAKIAPNELKTAVMALQAALKAIN